MEFIDVVQVALCGRCDLSCIMCGQPKADRHMPRAVLARLRDGLAAFPKPPILALAVRGEPTAHPEFPQAVRALAGLDGALPRPPFRELYLDTNARGLTADACDALLDVASAGPFVRLTVSTDAATGETYAAVRRGGDFDVLLNNVETFLSRRAARGMRTPALNFQFIVMRENEAEVLAFRDRFAALLSRFGSVPRLSGKYPEHAEDALSFVFHHPLDPSPARMEEETSRHRAALSALGVAAPGTTARRPEGEPCVWPFYMLVVREDGLVIPCCLDTRDELPLGSLAERTLPEILDGPAMTRLRLAHAGRLPVPARCRACPDQLVVERPGDKIARFLGRFDGGRPAAPSAGSPL